MHLTAKRMLGLTLAVVLAWAGRSAPAAGPSPAPTPAAWPPLAMQEPQDYPHAGITIALPRGYDTTAPLDPFEVLRATMPSDSRGRTSQTLTLLAFPIESQMTAELYAEAMLSDVARSGTLQNFRVHGKAEMKAAGLTGAGVRITYTSRGQDLVAIRVYFVREAPDGQFRLCYVLGLQSDVDRQGDLQPILTETLKSMRLTTVQHPSAATVQGSLPMIEDSREGFGFRAPRGWYVSAPKHDAVRRTERADGIPLVRSGLTLAQVDHLLGGQIVAELAVVTTEAPPDEPNDCDAAARLVKACEILAPPSRPMASEWPATLAGAPGYQTVLRVVEQELPGRLGEAVDGSLRQMVAIRAACVPVRGGRSRKGYALILRCQATDAAAAAALMARLSTSAFALSAATTQPASQPTSQPLTMPQIATTRPFTQPATSAATRPASQLATSARSTP